jgi:hypothetical protein
MSPEASRFWTGLRQLRKDAPSYARLGVRHATPAFVRFPARVLPDLCAQRIAQVMPVLRGGWVQLIENGLHRNLVCLNVFGAVAFVGSASLIS